MTVETTSTFDGPYTLNGIATAFPFTFKALSPAEVRVDIGSTSVDPSLFTVQLSAQGGTVVFASPPDGGDLWVISNPDFRQGISFSNQAAFLPASHNEANDRAAVRDQVLAEGLSRAPQTPLDPTAVVGLFPKVGGDGSWMYEAAGPGATGPANSTYTSLAALKAAPSTNRSYTLVANGGRTEYAYVTGDFTGRADDVNVVKLDAVPLTTGALVRLGATSITAKVGDGPARSASDSLAESISLESQRKTTNDQAQKAAQALALVSGAPVNYQAKDYSGGATGTNARVEAHGRGNFNGNGATIEYSATGKTPIAGTGSGSSCVPSVWVPDPSESVAAQYPTAIVNIAAAYPGDLTITCTDVPAAIVPPCFARLIGPPSAFSSGGSPGNYIPKWSEIVRVVSKAGNVLTLAAPVKYTYNSTRCLVDCFGTPVGSVQRDFIINGDPAAGDAYQMVGRDEIDCTRENILFLRDSAVGALTFAHNPVIRDCHAAGAYSAFSLARGNTGIATLENLSWQFRAAGGDKTAMFIEESFELIVMRKLRMYGAFSVRQVDMSGSPSKPHITLRDFLFDTSQWTDMSPFQNGSAFGVSWTIEGGTIRGPITNPSSYGGGTQYPGFAGSALAWFSGSIDGDRVLMRDVTFEATTGDGTAPAVRIGGSFQGRMMIEADSCRFFNCARPTNDLLTRPTLGGMVTLVGGTANVVFSSPLRGDQPYSIGLTSNVAESYTVTAKSASGFTITSPNNASNATVDWTAVVRS